MREVGRQNKALKRFFFISFSCLPSHKIKIKIAFKYSSVWV